MIYHCSKGCPVEWWSCSPCPLCGAPPLIMDFAEPKRPPDQVIRRGDGTYEVIRITSLDPELDRGLPQRLVEAMAALSLARPHVYRQRYHGRHEQDRADAEAWWARYGSAEFEPERQP